VCGINGETKTSSVSFSSSLLAYNINSAAAASSRASLFHVPLQLLLELVSLSLSAMFIYSFFPEEEREEG
jgi:hypothetical protein